MKNKKTLKNTLDSQVYKKALSANLGCPICGPNQGCNRNKNSDIRSWKKYRDNQWKSE